MNTPNAERDWKTELNEQRESEWYARCELLKLGKRMIAELEQELEKITPELAMKCFEMSSKLGRLAVGGVDAPPSAIGPDRDFMAEMTKALDRIEKSKGTHDSV